MMNIAAPISEMRINAIPGDLKKKTWKQIWPLAKLSYNNRPRFRKVRQLLIETGTSFYHSCFSSKLMTHKKAQPQVFLHEKSHAVGVRYLEVHVTWAEHRWIRCGTEQ